MDTLKKIAVVAPARLREAFIVLVQSASSVSCLASATGFDALLDNLQDEIPDVILLYVAKEASGVKRGPESSQQVAEIKGLWPDATCIALVEHPQQRETARAMGADVGLLEGVAPDRLLEAIESLNAKETDI